MLFVLNHAGPPGQRGPVGPPGPPGPDLDSHGNVIAQPGRTGVMGAIGEFSIWEKCVLCVYLT